MNIHLNAIKASAWIWSQPPVIPSTAAYKLGKVRTAREAIKAFAAPLSNNTRQRAEKSQLSNLVMMSARAV